MDIGFSNYKYDYDSLNKELLNQDIKIFKIIDLDLEDFTFEKVGEFLFLNDNCSDYEIHAGMFIVCFFKSSELCRTYKNEHLIELTYKQYKELLPSNYTVCGKQYTMGQSYFDSIVNKHRTVSMLSKDERDFEIAKLKEEKFLKVFQKVIDEIDKAINIGKIYMEFDNLETSSITLIDIGTIKKILCRNDMHISVFTDQVYACNNGYDEEVSGWDLIERSSKVSELLKVLRSKGYQYSFAWGEVYTKRPFPINLIFKKTATYKLLFN